jgi:hypothetical protein
VILTLRQYEREIKKTDRQVDIKKTREGGNEGKKKAKDRRRKIEWKRNLLSLGQVALDLSSEFRILFKDC